MATPPQLTPDLRDKLRGVLSLTHLGLWAERLARGFWPLWTVVALVLAALLLGLQDLVPVEVVWAIGAGAAVLALGFLAVIFGLRPADRAR